MRRLSLSGAWWIVIFRRRAAQQHTAHSSARFQLTEAPAALATLRAQAARVVARPVSASESIYDSRLCAGPECGVEEGFRGLFKTCGRCGKLSFCSKACQVAHWRAGHKKECTPRETGK